MNTASDSGNLRLVVRTGSGVALLAVNEIDYLEADGNFVVVHTGSDGYRIRLPLSSLLSWRRRCISSTRCWREPELQGLGARG